MSWNNGYERKQFFARMKKQAEEYRKAGMTEEQIKAMYEFDLAQFNCDRKYYRYTQPLESNEFDDGVDESDNSLMKQFFYEMSSTDDNLYFFNSDRYGWIDSINHPLLSECVTNLSAIDKDIITLHVFEGHDLKETATILGLPHVNAWRRFERFKKKVFEIFSEK